VTGQTDLAQALRADKTAALHLCPVSRETARRLDVLVDLLLEWQGKMNLVAPSTLSHLWTRHIADSLQLVPLAPKARVWVDLGSGAGFPGLVIACALAEQSDAAVHLVESTGKKANFLREAARCVNAPAFVHAQRIDEFAKSWSQSADAVTARALAPITRLLEHAFPFLQKGAQGLFLKGQDVEAELTDAAKYWRIEIQSVPSVTDSRGRVLIVRRAQRIGKAKP